MSVVAAEVSKWALRDVSFELPPGSVTAMVGANGSGKTTLLNVLAGHLMPETGHTSIAGRVAYVPQHKPMYKSFRVADVLEFGRRMNTVWDHGRAEQWLNRFRIPRKLQIEDLSGGERTHVVLALALGSRPDVLMLDEPLAELDPLARRKVMRELLTEVNDKGMTLIFSTHAVGEIAGVADRLLVLSRGRIAGGRRCRRTAGRARPLHRSARLEVARGGARGAGEARQGPVVVPGEIGRPADRRTLDGPVRDAGGTGRGAPGA